MASSSATGRHRGHQSNTATSMNIEKKDWFHGMLPREDIAKMLKNQGQFLVRVTEPKQGQGLRKVLSVYWQSKIHHYIINESPDGSASIESLKFGSIVELVEYYYNSKRAVSVKSGAKLLSSVPKQGWELHHEQIDLGKMLGEGAFGAVHKGTLQLESEKINVAVKVNKCTTVNKDTIKEICREARIMRHYSHDNVVRFYGVAVEKEPIMLVMELVNDGALDSYLVKHAATLTTNKKINMCFDAAKGLEYLHDRGCIHRDVAARNCLVSDGRVKISDFGLSHELKKNGDEFKLTNLKQKLPIRWLAPEVLTTASYTTKSDVFSYGIMMWEIFSDGADPYPGMTGAEVSVFVKSGNRMDPPASMPHDVRKVQLKCYPGDPSERWSMMQVRRQLEELAGGNSSKKGGKKRKDDTEKGGTSEMAKSH